MIEELKKVLNYDPESGELRWLEQMGAHVWAGDIAGTLRKDGYLMIRFRGNGYLSHRVAYALMTGNWPDGEIDHIDRDKLNNKWSNLRLASRSLQNHNKGDYKNNRTGYKGVNLKEGKYVARVQIENKRHHLGYFGTAQEAYEAIKTFKNGAFVEL